MTANVSSRFASLMLMAIFATAAQAHSPADFLEVFSVEPIRQIEHSVDLKGAFDDASIKTDLEGPRFLARAVGGMGRGIKKPVAYLSWFKIVNPPALPKRSVDVLDLFRGGDRKSLTISSAEYLLSPSQRITTGVPDPIPNGLDHYTAYRVVDPPKMELQLNLTESVGPPKRQLGRPLFVCLPTEEWHHDEHFKVTHPSDGFVVYELDEQEHVEAFTTIGQFGLNELKSAASQWIAVKAILLKPSQKETDD